MEKYKKNHTKILNLKYQLQHGTNNFICLLMLEIIKLLSGSKSKAANLKMAKMVSRLEITEVVLVHCYIVKNYYQQDSRVLYTFVPNKSFGA